MKGIAPYILSAYCAGAAQYYVRTDGNDSNAGTTNNAGGAWFTLQQAANSVAPGDTVTVVSGTYQEYVDIITAGSAALPITWKTSGTVNVRGFDIDQPYQIVDGFSVSDYSPASNRGAIHISSAGDNAVVKNCTFRLDVWASGANIVFNTSNNGSITVPSGGLNSAGFRAGMYVVIGRNTSSTTPANNGDTYLVQSVSDTVLTLSSDVGMVDETTSCIISGTYAYGVYIANNATNCLVHNNSFIGQAAPWVFISGSDNTFTRNTMVDGDGWDAIVYSGTDNIISWNTITNGVSTAYNASPDVFEHWSPIATTRFIFAHNFVNNWDGVIGLHKNSSIGSNAECHFISNVFANTGRLMIRMPNCHVKNNTFYKVAFESTSVRSSQNHAVFFDDQAGALTGCKVEDNVFVACGDAAASTKGWYSAHAGQTLSADYNWVCGDSPSFSAKTGFSETNGTNGGNPVLISLSNLIGVDGTAWTSDDGLSPAGGSNLLSSSHNGMDRGAYQVGNVFWVSPLGSDVAAGTGASPWKTLTYANTQMTSGKTLMVDFGTYNERPTISTGGAVDNRIRWYSHGGELPSKGGSAFRGVSISADHITMDGMEITGDITNDAVRILSTADNGVIKNFYIHDTVPSGTAFEAVSFIASSGNDPATASQSWVISDCLVERFGATIFVLHGRYHTVERNVVRDLTEDLFRCFGVGHTIRFNLLESMTSPTTGHPDVFQSWSTTAGQNHWCKDIVVEDNFFLNQMYYSTASSVSFQDNGASPDTITRASGSWISDGYKVGHNLTVWGAANSANNSSPSYDIAVVTDLTLTLEADESLTTSLNDSSAKLMACSTIQPGQMDDPSANTTNVVFRRNVWWQIDGGGTAMFSNYTFENNVFVDCNWLVSHVWLFSYGGGGTLRNNVFLGCGRGTNKNGIDAARGWYGAGASNTNGPIIGNYNYVASSNFAAKNSSFTEANGVNGGDPLFQNASNPLGPDGIPWTSDDGFMPLPGSVLLGAGEGGSDIGAYGEGAAPSPSGGAISAQDINAATVTISQ